MRNEANPHSKRNSLSLEKATHRGLLQCVEMVGPDRRMDQKGNWDAPVNPLPIKCPRCKFVELNFLPQSYGLFKAIDTPSEIAPAEVGNFLVRERVRRIFEIAIPGQCDFYPTHHLKTKQSTPWFLSVPKGVLETGLVKQSIKRCPECGEPDSAHGTQYDKRYQVSESPFDVFKSSNWISVGEKAPDYTKDYYLNCVDHRHALALDRELYFSTRLETLLKKLAVRGMCRGINFTAKPTANDVAWAQEKVRLVENSSTKTTSTETSANEWFENYLKNTGKKTPKPFNFERIEQTQGFALPSSYKEFASKIGKKIFKNMDGEDGFNVKILLPEDLDFVVFRKAANRNTEQSDDEQIDAVVFATTEHGDVLCFDVTQKNGDYPIHLYNHEMEDFEPFTVNFATCIQRLAGGK